MEVNERTLKGWVARGCPRDSPEAVRVWRADHLLPRKGGPGGEKETDETEAGNQRRIVAANADKAEEDARAARLRNDEREGLVVEKAQVTREYAEQFAQARTILDAFPDQFAKEAPAKLRTSAHELARKSIERVLRLLAGIRGQEPVTSGQ